MTPWQQNASCAGTPSTWPGGARHSGADHPRRLGQLWMVAYGHHMVSKTASEFGWCQERGPLAVVSGSTRRGSLFARAGAFFVRADIRLRGPMSCG